MTKQGFSSASSASLPSHWLTSWLTTPSSIWAALAEAAAAAAALRLEAAVCAAAAGAWGSGVRGGRHSPEEEEEEEFQLVGPSSVGCSTTQQAARL